MQLYVDTGGTFTDVLGKDDRGNWRRLKVLSSSALRVSVASFDVLDAAVNNVDSHDGTSDHPLHNAVRIKLTKPLPCKPETLVG